MLPRNLTPIAHPVLTLSGDLLSGRGRESVGDAAEVVVFLRESVALDCDDAKTGIVWTQWHPDRTGDDHIEFRSFAVSVSVVMTREEILHAVLREETKVFGATFFGNVEI